MRTNLRSQLRTLANKEANRRECRVNSQPPNSLHNINDFLAERKGFELTVRLPLAVRCKKASGVNYTAISATQCRSNPVSVRRLPETGIFHISAGDYRGIRPARCQIGSPEIIDRLAKATIGGHFCDSSERISRGWTAWLAPQCCSHRSPHNFPANREFYREFWNSGALSGDSSARNYRAAAAFRTFPCSN